MFKRTNTLIILDDCAASRNVKQRTNELVNLAFSAGHKGISVWVFTKQMTSIAKPFTENTAVIVIFYTPSAKDMKMIFEDYAGELMKDEQKEFVANLERVKYSHLNFLISPPLQPFSIDLTFNNILYNGYE